jgi:hypothetical protein
MHAESFGIVWEVVCVELNAYSIFCSKCARKLSPICRDRSASYATRIYDEAPGSCKLLRVGGHASCSATCRISAHVTSTNGKKITKAHIQELISTEQHR